MSESKQAKNAAVPKDEPRHTLAQENRLKHTPGPRGADNWPKGSDPIVEYIWTDGPHVTVLIAECMGRDRNANAAHIVKCVNSYDQMLEALKTIHNMLVQSRSVATAPIDIIETAIQAAEKETKP